MCEKLNKSETIALTHEYNRYSLEAQGFTDKGKNGTRDHNTSVCFAVLYTLP